MRPDIALAIPTGPNAGLHLFDAKFRLDRLDALLPIADEETDAERQQERRGTFKRADLYKMHTYRDAIPEARTVWILYPGSEMRFFPADPQQPPVTTFASTLPVPLAGVGAIPLLPAEASPALRDLLMLLTAPAV